MPNRPVIQVQLRWRAAFAPRDRLDDQTSGHQAIFGYQNVIRAARRRCAHDLEANPGFDERAQVGRLGKVLRAASADQYDFCLTRRQELNRVSAEFFIRTERPMRLSWRASTSRPGRTEARE